ADIWAVGFTATSNFVDQTLIEQWNGSNWSVVPSPSPSTIFNILNAAAADKTTGQAWAVGTSATPASTCRRSPSSTPSHSGDPRPRLGPPGGWFHGRGRRVEGSRRYLCPG